MDDLRGRGSVGGGNVSYHQGTQVDVQLATPTRAQVDGDGQLNLPLVGLFVRALEIPRRFMAAAILSICIIGVYSTNLATFDILLRTIEEAAIAEAPEHVLVSVPLWLLAAWAGERWALASSPTP